MALSIRDRSDERLFLLRPVKLETWLSTRLNIANSIKWQHQFGRYYQLVEESCKLKYPDWSELQKSQLQEKFNVIWRAFHKPKDSRSLKYSSYWSGTLRLDEDLTYPPINRIAISSSSSPPFTLVKGNWAWNMYLNFVAYQLFVEIKELVGWSINSLSPDLLATLFDSSTIFLKEKLHSYEYYVGSAVSSDPSYVQRSQNLGSSIIAPAGYTYRFLKVNRIIGSDRISTIVNLLTWIMNNLTHFFGRSNYRNANAIWQYRGLPPITRVIEGTTDANLHLEAKWTLGCHGTLGFIKNILRIVNIPVYIQIIGGHATGCFPTENLYLDHGDNLYHGEFKAGVRAGRFTVRDVLVTEAQFNEWFGSSRNNSNARNENIGRRVRELVARS